MDATLKTQAEKLAREMATQATTVDDLNGLLRTMMKSALERMLNTEMDVHLGRRTPPVTTGVPESDRDPAPSGTTATLALGQSVYVWKLPGPDPQTSPSQTTDAGEE